MTERWHHLRRASMVFYLLGTVSGFLIVVFMVLAMGDPGAPGNFEFLAASTVTAILFLATGWGLSEDAVWARWLAYAQAVLLLLAFPVGTVAAAFILVYLHRARRSG